MLWSTLLKKPAPEILVLQFTNGYYNQKGSLANAVEPLPFFGEEKRLLPPGSNFKTAAENCSRWKTVTGTKISTAWYRSVLKKIAEVQNRESKIIANLIYKFLNSNLLYAVITGVLFPCRLTLVPLADVPGSKVSNH